MNTPDPRIPDGDEVPVPPARKPWFRKARYIAPLVLAVLIGLEVINGIAHAGQRPATAAQPASPPASTAPAKPASPPASSPGKSAAYPDQAADKALCSTFNTDMTAGDTTDIQTALDQAGGSVSPGLAKDVQVVVNNPGSVSQDEKNQLNVAMDCGLVDAGKAPPAQGFSGAAASAPAAPATTAPAPAASTPPASAPAPAAPTVTGSQQQALDSATSYLGLDSGFSRQGLIDQLDSPYGGKFSVADATWAADHSGADWDAQAVLAAKGYMALGTGFSRSALIDQLDSPYGGKFTYAQAAYAAGQVGL